MASKETLSHDVISFGTVYLDVDFLSFPFVEGIFAHRETVGDQYTLEVGVQKVLTLADRYRDSFASLYTSAKR